MAREAGKQHAGDGCLIQYFGCGGLCCKGSRKKEKKGSCVPVMSASVCVSCTASIRKNNMSLVRAVKEEKQITPPVSLWRHESVLVICLVGCKFWQRHTVAVSCPPGSGHDLRRRAQLFLILSVLLHQIDLLTEEGLKLMRDGLVLDCSPCWDPG